MAGLNLGNQGDGNGPASPSETNPYRSPLADRNDEGHGEHETDRLPQAGPSDQQSNFGTFPRSFGAAAFDGSDRSQTSSVGAKGFASVNPLSGWPAGPSVSTPDRERASFQHAFGGSFFSPLAELPSPGLAGLGGVFGPPSASRLGRGKLESLFPPAMQAQMHGHDQDNLNDSVPDLRQANPLGAIGRGTIGSQRDTASPVRSVRGGFEDLFQPPESTRSPFSTAEQAQSGLTSTAQAQSFPVTTGGASFPSTQSAADPTSVRTMVMPDRMRWVYLDPQGIMQGPFSGLEMNDWYKANFFTPDLRVKRLEDPDFEPLGQLIRRIGNSREPFLVPQMGIPHGPPPAASPFGGSGAEAIPPLPNFPTFGRTLTAQQQNDLERRKQEEQMFHARQRELAQHHAAFGRLPTIQPGVPGALHHHSSAHSLQSQPSFGSMTSPIGMTPQHPLGPIAPGAGFFDSAAAMAPGPAQPPIGPAPSDIFAPDLNFSERQMLASMTSAGALPGAFPSTHAVGGPVGDTSGLRSQLPSLDQLQKDSEGFSERLEEFHELRAQFDAEQAAAAGTSEVTEDIAHEEQPAAPAAPEPAKEPVPSSESAESKKTAKAQELTLTEKVRKTQADNAKSSQPQPASDLPMPFPPPVQATPLAAPTAQRPASGLPARYGDRSASGTPDTTSDGAALAPPPTAPWAPQPGAEMQKGPSLKEIQEAEAKKAAKKEEAAAAARRAALEQEAAAIRERERAAAAAANPALPATSNWATGSPVGTPGGSPWKQPAALKSAASVAGSSTAKKTLADIQREEEARKQKAREAAAAAAQASTPPVSAMGKRYADLAGKSSASPNLVPSTATAQASQGGGWATVGAGGKVKAPTGPAVQSRSASVSVKASPSPVAAKPAPKPAQTSLKDAKSQAMEEFKKWLHRELARGLIGVADSEFSSAIILLRSISVC
jgi:PERQ amino acid-rich with GYF domain-containing protein